MQYASHEDIKAALSSSSAVDFAPVNFWQGIQKCFFISLVIKLPSDVDFRITGRYLVIDIKYWIVFCNISHKNTLTGLQRLVEMIGKYIGFFYITQLVFSMKWHPYKPYKS